MMAFPEDVPLRLELAFGADPAGSAATWSDVSGDVHRQQVTIRRGRADESGQPTPAAAAVQLDNPRGDYTPDHPLGAHYPLVRQGVPARLSVRAGGPHLRLRPTGTARARTAASPALDVAGDLDVRLDVALDRVPAQWGPSAPSGFRPWAGAMQELIGRYGQVPGERMWRLLLDPAGAISFGWYPDGTSIVTAVSTRPLPVTGGQRVTVRVTLDVDNGAGGWTVRFSTGSGVEGPWELLGEPVAGMGVTSITTAGGPSLDLGNVGNLAYVPGGGRYYRAQVRDGIDGTLVADFNATNVPPGATGWTDSVGRAWELLGAAEITDWRTRLLGTVDDWAPTWPYGDLSDPDDPVGRPGEARCDITISGPLRRLGAGAPPLQSTLRRRIPSQPVLAYWPLEEGPASTQAASGLPDGRPATTAGLRWAAASDLPSSAPLPVLDAGARLGAPLPALPDPALGWRVEMVYKLDAMPPSRLGWFRVDTAGGGIGSITAYIGGGQAEIRLFDPEGATISFATYDDPAAMAAATAGWCRLRLVALPAPGGWTYRAWWTPIGESQNWYVFRDHPQGTRPTRVNCVWPTALNGMPIGHITLVNDPSVDPYGGGTGGPDTGYAGERALARMRRLAEEEELLLSVPGEPAESPRMGPQRVATVLELIKECADADGGILAEAREVYGIQYRPRYLLYNQQPRAVLSARANEIDNPFQPVLDDQRYRTRWTVSRTDGSSATVEDTDAIAARGLYPDSATLNLYEDADLEPQAAWRLHRSAWPGMRYPAVAAALDLAPQTAPAWMDAAEGDRIQVTDLPPQHPTDAVDLLAEGLTETLTPTRWSVTATASAGGPWRVGEVGGGDPADDRAPVRADTDGAELDAAVAAADTALIVDITGTQPWATTAGPAPTAGPGDYPADITVGGEVMRVSGIEPFLWDDFSRTVTGGWGTAPCATAAAWTLSGGDPADRTVSNATAAVALPEMNTPAFQLLSSWTIPDVDVVCSIAPSAVAAGAPILAGLALRISGSSWYWPRLVLSTAGTVGIEIADGLAPATSLVSTGLIYSAGTRIWLRARQRGATIQARAWLDGRAEPTRWHVTWTGAGSVATGRVGTVAMTTTGSSLVSPSVAFRAFRLISPQLMTVERSVNGISKAHAVGAALALADPMTIAL